MNAPVLLAQLQGNNTSTGSPPRNIKLEKPQGGATVTVYLNGPIHLDFADIASEKLTFVRVGDKLIVLFDNQSTVTLEPVFGTDGHPLNNIAFEMTPDHLLSGEQFASEFPISTDQSILPAAGAGGGPASGAHFSDPTVDPLSTGTPLALLGGEGGAGGTSGFIEAPANVAPTTTPITPVIFNEDGLPGGNPGGPGDVGGVATTFTGSLNINFGTATVGASLAFSATQNSLNGLTSGGEAVHFTITTIGGEPTLIAYVGTDPSIIANEVLTISLNVANDTFTATLLRPLDEPIHGIEDTLDLSINVIATNGAGQSTTTTISIDINDDSPIVVAANETHSTITDVVPGSVVTATGSLGISFGADNFNNVVDGGNTGQNGDRAVVFTDANVTVVGEANGVGTTITTLTSDGQAVHFVLLNNGTELVAYTGNAAPTTFPTDATSAASEHVVFTVSLSDASNTGSYTVAQYEPLDHNTGATLFDAINLSFNFTATDSDGDPVSGTLTATVTDTAPTVTETLVTHSTITDPVTFSHATATGTLGISWGSDNFNAVADGGVTAADGDRAVIFTNATVTTTGSAANGDNTVVTSFTGLTSENLAVHYVLLDNGTVLVAYTGDVVPTTVPSVVTTTVQHGDEGPPTQVTTNPPNIVFVVTLTDDSATGGYSITQYQPLDHIENGTKFTSIDLTFNFTAIDSDGDPATGTLTVTVDDTVPTVTGVVFDTFVGEDGLPNGHTGTNGVNGDITTLTVSSSLDINWGADSETVAPGSSFGRTLSFLAGDDATVIPGSSTTAVSSLAMTVSGAQNDAALTSGGVALVYVITSDGNGGEMLTAHKGSVDGATIFTLDLNPATANGSYTFTLNGPLDDAVGSSSIALTFTVQAADADGDTVNQTFTVNVQDDVPIAGTGTPDSVKEANLPDGSSPNSHNLSVTDSLNIAWGADNNNSGNTDNRSVSFQHATASADVQVTDVDGNTINGLTSNGALVHYTIFNNELIAYTGNDARFNQVFTVSLNDDGTGSYTFTLLSNLDHPNANGNNTLNLTFDFTATDADGDQSSNTFTVTVVDDVPTAHVGDTTTINEANLPNGNFPLLFFANPSVSGDLNIVWGADNNDSGNTNNRSVSFTNSSNAAQDVTVTTTDPVTHQTTTLGGLTSDGNTVNYEFINGVLVGYTGSKSHPDVVFTVALDDNGDGSYTFTLLGTLDNPPGQGTNPLNLTFNYTATDSDGDTSSNVFTVSVKDSVPLAFGADNAHVDEDDLSTGTSPHASALADTESLNIGWGSDDSTRGVGDTFGRTLSFLDGNSTVISGGSVSSLAMSITGEQGNNILTSGGVALVYTVTANVNGGETLTAFKGVGGAEIFTLTLDPTAPNGAYTFTLMGPLDDALHSNSIGLTFTVQAADADGDPVNTSFTVSIADDSPTTSSISTKTVGEEGLTFANHNVNGESQFATATTSLNINWGADNSNPTTGGGTDDRQVVFASNMTNLLDALHLTSNGQALSYAVTQDSTGALLTATAGSDHHTIFTVQLSDASNGSYVFTLVDNIDHPSSNTPANFLPLSFFVVATDSDGDSVNQSFTVNVQDDVPILSGNVMNGTVNEDGLPTGNQVATNQHITLTDELLNISWGADQATIPGGDANGRTLSFNVSSSHGAITPQDSHGDALSLFSDGQALTYVLTNLANGGQEIDAYRGSTHNASTLIFTVTLDPTSATGDYNFTLSGNLDDVTSHGTPTSDIQLNFGVTGTDSDGDSVQTNFTIDVLDDTPIARVGASDTISEANLPHGTSPDQSALAASGSLNIEWGADNGSARSAAFSNATVAITDSNGNAVTTGLTSDGLAVHFAVLTGGVDAGWLVAYTGSLPTTATAGNVVFNVALDNNNYGDYRLNLLQTLDDPSGSTSLKFTFNYTATDSDGDKSSSTFSVTVDDDTPIIGTTIGDVSEDGPKTLINAALVNMGADNGTFAGSQLALAFTDNTVAVTDSGGTPVALTSYGNAIHIGFIGTELVGYTGTTAPTSLTDTHIVFTATLSASGTYDFALKQPIDNPAPVNGNTSLNLTFDITATDADGSTASGHFTVNVDAAGSTSTPGVIDYSNETTGVFVNLTGSAVTFAGQSVAAHTATDLASGGGHVIGDDQLGAITNANGGSGNDVFALTSTQFAAAPHIAGGGGSDTLVITDAGATLVDADFANVSGIETLKVHSATITLGADASAEIGTGTLLVDATGESLSSGTAVDFTAMTADFAFTGGALTGDTVTVTNAQFESGLSLSASNSLGIAGETVVIADAADITDAAFASVSQFLTLKLGNFTNSVTLGADASADAASIGGGFRAMEVDGSAATTAGHDLTVDASGFDDSDQLTLDGGAGDDLFKVTAAGLDSGNFFIDGGAGSNTIELADTASFNLVDNDFANVSNIETLAIAPGAGAVATITLGTNFSANADGGTFTVDATGESSTGSTVVDFTAMTADFAFDGGAGNDTITITSTQFAAVPHIAGGGGSDTLVITDAGATLVDADFANVSSIETLKVHSATITLGADASAEIGTGTLLVDATGESLLSGTAVDFTAMTADFAFTGGALTGDTVTVTNAQFESGLSLSASNSLGIAGETVVIADAADITDAAFASVSQFLTLKLGNFTNSVTLGADASADAASIGGGFRAMEVDGSAATTAGHDLTVDASGFDDSDQLTLDGGAGDDLFKVTAAGLDSGNFFIDGGAGSNTIELAGTASFNLIDNDFANVSNIEMLKVDGPSDVTDTLTLGENADTNANGGTFTIDDTAGKENLKIDAVLMDSDLVVSLGSGNDTITGGLGANTFIGGTGADDFIWYVSEPRLETVIGGTGPGIQTQTVNDPTDIALTFVVGAIDATHLGVSLGLDASTAALAISDTNVQELVFNLGSGGDTVVVNGSLDGTGLAENTITINGGAGNDTVDLSKFTSDQDVVYNGAGNGPAGDTVIYGFAFSAGTYAPVLDSNGHVIGATITYQSKDGPVTDTITNVENFKFTDQTLTLAQLFPPAITSGNSGTEAEGTPVTNVVYHIATSDQNPAAVLTYSLTGTDAADFNVSSTGDVTFKSVPNFETQSTYNIVVHANDGTTDATEAVTIHVTDVAPVAVADSYTVVKNTSATVSAASGVLANDSDIAGGALTAVLVSGPIHDASFTLNADGSFTYKSLSTFSGMDTFTYEASDGTDRSNLVTVTLNVANANAAPVLTPFGPQLTSVHTVNDGQTIASIVGSSITDVDAGAMQGIAINGITTSNGSWQYSLNGGVTWTTISSASPGQSLLLKSTDLIRYEPSNNSGSTDTFTYRAWDETTGTDGSKVSTSSNGGSTAFSTATDTAHITVTTDANHAPVLTPSSPTLAMITEDQTNPAGTTIATLLGSHVSDADPEALQGIAITGATSTHGTWEYSTNGGTTWQNFSTYSASSALLLAATDEVRFVPDAIDGSADTFSFVAWDQTTGTHGTTADTTTNGATTAFSVASDTASISVTAIDDAPVVHSPTGAATAPQGVPVTITGLSVSDVDAYSLPISVTLSVAHGTISLANTAGLTFTDSDGSDGTLAFTGSQQAIDTALASGVVYTSNGNYLGSDAINVLVNDLGNTGQGGPLTGTGSAAISVVTPHHAPVGTDNTVTINEDAHYIFAAADFGFSDPNDTPADSFSGVVITTLPTGGTLTDNGAAVTAGEVISIADINAHDLVFTPAANANGTMSFTFQVQDSGIAFAPENTDQSPNTMTVNVTAVNDPPTISYAGPQSSPTNIVVNGGFETGDLTGWSTPGITIKVTTAGGLQHSGFNAAEMYAFGPTTDELDQTLATVAGQTYTLQFWVSHATAVPSLSDSFTASWNGTQVMSLTGAAAEGNFGYTEFTETVVATSSSTVLDFTSFDTGYIWYLDDVSVVANPQNIASVNEGTNLVFSTANGNALQVADIDVNETPAPNNIMQVTLGVAHGDLTLSETAGISFISGGNATGGMTIQGTLAALDAALNGLTYQADNYNGSDTLSINVNDLGHTGIGGPQTASSSVAITVAPNIPATFSGTDTGSVTEAGGVNNSIPGTPTTGGTLIVTDPDSPNTVVVENNIATLYGHFSITAAGVWSYTLDNTNAAVQALNTTSTPLQDVATITTADGSTHQIDVTVNGANDAATFSGTDTGSVTEAGGVNNGSPGIPTTGGTLTVSDVDSSATIMAENNVATAYGHFSIDANGVWSYTLDDNNATVQALNTNSTPLQDVVTVTSADGTTHQIDVTINGADDAPVNTVSTAQAVSNAAQLTFSAANGDAISVSDVDNTTLTETLTVSHGTLTLASEAGLSFSAGHDGTSTMTFTGTVAAIDSALNGLIYTPASGYFGADKLQIVTNDGSLETDSSVAITVYTPDQITTGPEGVTVTGGQSSIPAANVVVNGGFETWSYNSQTQTYTVPDWTAGNLYSVGVGNGAHSGSVAFGAPPVAHEIGSISQTVATTAGQLYQIEFWAVPTGNTGNANSIAALWDGTTELSFSSVQSITTNNPTSSSQYVEYTATVLGTGSDTLSIDFAAPYYWFIDDVSITPVVTPGTETRAGVVTFTDADTTDTHSITVTPDGTGYYGVFTPTLVDSTGSGIGAVDWTYSVSDSAIQSLAAGQSVTQSYTITISDGHGGVTTQVETITVQGGNDAPVLSSTDKVALNNEVAGGGSTNLVQDPGFETTLHGPWTLSTTDSHNDAIVSNNAHSGSHAMEFGQSTGQATITQSIATTAGTSYTLTFWLKDVDAVQDVFNVNWNGQTVFTQTYNGGPEISTSYTQYSVTVVGGAGTSSSLQFAGGSLDGFWYLDDVSLSAGLSGVTGTQVSSLIASGSGPNNVTDVDSGAKTGMAITAAATANGTWYYSTDGVHWTAISSVSSTNALLLAADATTSLYFQANAGFTGTATITYEAWDQTSGTSGTYADASVTGGSTAFSSATETATVTVGNVTSGTTFTLTSSADSVFYASGSGTHTVSGTGTTLNSTDKLIGAGADTLNLNLSSISSPLTVHFDTMAAFYGFSTVALTANPGNTASFFFGNANVFDGQTITVDAHLDTSKTFSVDASGVTDGGNFTFIAGGGITSFKGGSGNDLFEFTSTEFNAAPTVTGAGGIDTLQITDIGVAGYALVDGAFALVTGVEVLKIGGGGPDSVTLSTHASHDVGDAAGTLTIDDSSGTGNLTVTAQAGFLANLTVIASSGADTLNGNSGNDTFEFSDAHFHNASQTVNGGTGNDAIWLTDATSITVTDNDLINVLNIETLRLGNAAADSISLGLNASTDVGGIGHNFTVDDSAGTGILTVDGSQMTANLIVLLSKSTFNEGDHITGGSGSNTIELVDSTGTVITDSAFAHLAGINDLQLGGAANNSVTLGPDADVNAGGVGHTFTVDGSSGTGGLVVDGSAMTANLNLIGGSGNDTLIGGSGNDTFTAGSGNDIMIGGAGADTFKFSTEGAPTVDRILNFGNAQGDKIDISALLGSSQGAADTGNIANYVHFATRGEDLVLQVDTSGSGAFTGGSHDVVQLASYAVSNQHIVDVVFNSHDHQIAV